MRGVSGYLGIKMDGVYISGSSGSTSKDSMYGTLESQFGFKPRLINMYGTQVPQQTNIM